MTDEWRQIRDYPYEVSSSGSVRRIDGRTLRQRRIWTGYIRFTLSVNGERIQAYAHRLVAEAFIGPLPSGKEVDHLNSKKDDNRASNLAYVTPKENTRKAHRDGLCNPRSGDEHPWRTRPELVRRGEKHPGAKLSEADVAEIRRLLGVHTQARIAKMFGVSQSLVSRIATDRIWTKP